MILQIHKNGLSDRLLKKIKKSIFSSPIKSLRDRQALPEVDAVDEEQAHHQAIKEKHTGHVEIRWIAHS